MNFSGKYVNAISRQKIRPPRNYASFLELIDVYVLFDVLLVLL